MAETKATEKKQVGEHSFTADQQNWEQVRYVPCGAVCQFIYIYVASENWIRK